MKTYTSDEFDKLKRVTYEDLKANKSIVTKDAEVNWYVLYGTPDGKYLTANLWYADSCQKTINFSIRKLDQFVRLVPETPKTPERKERWFDVFEDGPYFGSGGFSTKGMAVKYSKYGLLLKVEVEKQPDGTWIVVTDTKAETEINYLAEINGSISSTFPEQFGKITVTHYDKALDDPNSYQWVRANDYPQKTLTLTEAFDKASRVPHNPTDWKKSLNDSGWYRDDNSYQWERKVQPHSFYDIDNDYAHGLITYDEWMLMGHADFQVNPTKEPTRKMSWVNVYRDGPIVIDGGYATQEEANEIDSKGSRLAVGQAYVELEQKPNGLWKFSEKKEGSVKQVDDEGWSWGFKGRRKSPSGVK